MSIQEAIDVIRPYIGRKLDDSTYFYGSMPEALEVAINGLEILHQILEYCNKYKEIYDESYQAVYEYLEGLLDIVDKVDEV